MTIRGPGVPAFGVVEAQALVELEPPQEHDKPRLTGWLQRLCRAAVRDLHVSGVGVSVMSESGDALSRAASDRVHERIEELQFLTGEGPCFEAFAQGRPVLTPDLGVAARRWPGFAPAAQAQGVCAIFAFPLQVGAARLGAVDVYRTTVGGLEPTTMARAVTFTEVALWSVLDAQGRAQTTGVDDGTGHEEPDGLGASVLSDAQDDWLEVYQAQGMVAVQLGVPIAEATARLRAYAFVHDRRVGEVARDVVARTLVFLTDPPA